MNYEYILTIKGEALLYKKIYNFGKYYRDLFLWLICKWSKNIGSKFKISNYYYF